MSNASHALSPQAAGTAIAAVGCTHEHPQFAEHGRCFAGMRGAGMSWALQKDVKHNGLAHSVELYSF